MGWTWYRASEYTKSGKVSPSREIRKETRRHLFDYQEILAEAFVKGVYYAAIRDNRTNEVWALVCLTGTTTTDYYNFGYKDMDESMGPYNYDCPDRILDLLTKTDSESANEWREKCRESNSRGDSFKSLPDGAMAKWKCPPHMSGLEEGRVYTIRKGRQNAWKKRSPWVWHIEGTRWCVKPALVGDGYELLGDTV